MQGIQGTGLIGATKDGSEVLADKKFIVKVKVNTIKLTCWCYIQHKMVHVFNISYFPSIDRVKMH